MANTNFNVAPYYDDYDESKKFHRILFKPGVAVQARELTQLQTILQNQVSRHGDHVFKDGTFVKGGEQVLKRDADFIKIQDSFVDVLGGAVDVTQLEGASFTCAGTGVTGTIVKAVSGAETQTNKKTIYVNYTNSGNDKQTQAALRNEIINVQLDSGTRQIRVVDELNSTGKGVLYTVTEGIMYVNGYFVKHDTQTVVLSRYDVFPSVRCGILVEERIVNFDEDETLLDPAQGTYNFNAPGADRLQYVTTVTAYKYLDENGAIPNAPGFYEMMVLVNGQKTKVVKQTEYAKIAEELARRTFAESGDYTVEPFRFNIRESQRSVDNQGIFSNNLGDANTLIITSEGGYAYVSGFEQDFRQVESTLLPLRKGTDTRSFTDVKVAVDYGNYVVVNEVVGSFDSTSFKKINLRDAAHQGITNAEYLNNPNGNIIGSATLRSLQFKETSTTTGGDDYYLFLQDVKVTGTGNTFSDVKSFEILDGSTTVGYADAVQTYDIVSANNVTKLEDKLLNGLIRPLIYPGTKSATNIELNRKLYLQESSVTGPSITFNSSSTKGAPLAATNDISKRDRYMLVCTSSVANTTTAIAGHTFDINTTTGVGFLTSNTGVNNLQDYFAVGDLVTPNATNLFVVTGFNNSANATVKELGGTGTLAFSGSTLYRSFEPGTIIHLDKLGSDGTERTVSVVGNDVTIDLNETFSPGISVDAYFQTNKPDASFATKSKVSNQKVVINTNTHPNGSTGPYNLGISDLLEVQKIIRTPFEDTATTPDEANNSHVDITSLFTVDNGQRAGFYDHAKIVPVAGQSFSNCNIGVVYRRFTHTRGDATPYFTVGSYPINDGAVYDANTQIRTYQIPFFVDPVLGSGFDLRECIDLRPAKVDTAAATTSFAGATVNPATTFAYDSNYGALPIFNDVLEVDTEHYLPRIDKVILNKNGELLIKEGVSDFNPKIPVDIPDALTLARVVIPPYPTLSPYVGQSQNRADLAAVLVNQDNQRYTMSDIGEIEKRIDRLEYYTSLSLLEKEAADLSITDADGNDRYKNGIIVDNFTGHGVGKVKDPDYKVSIDLKTKSMRPSFELNTVDYELDSASLNNVQRAPKEIIITATTTTAVTATSSATFNGNVVASSGATGRLLYFINDQVGGNHKFCLEAINEDSGIFSVGVTVNVPGVSDGTSQDFTITAIRRPRLSPLVTKAYENITLVTQPYSTDIIGISPSDAAEYAGKIKLIPDFDNWVDTETKPDLIQNLDGDYDNWQTLANAWGTQWGDWETYWAGSTAKKEKVGSYYNNTGYRYGWGHGQGGYGFQGWGGWWGWSQTRTDVVEYTTTTTEKQSRLGTQLDVTPDFKKTNLGTRVVDVNIVPYMRSKEIVGLATGMKPGTKLYAFFDDIDVTEDVIYGWPDNANSNIDIENARADIPSDVTIPVANNSADLVTDSKGNLFFTFILPNTEQKKFRTGSKVFKLTDINANDLRSHTTIATTTYEATGLTQAKQDTITSTRNGKLSIDTVVDQRKVITTDKTRDAEVYQRYWWNNWNKIDGSLADGFQPNGSIYPYGYNYYGYPYYNGYNAYNWGNGYGYGNVGTGNYGQTSTSVQIIN